MKSSHREPAHEKAHNLDRLFHPGSVAVVGALSDAEKWYIRQYYIAPLLELGYKGRIYAVDSRGKDVPGAVSCRSVREIPGPVDLVVGCLSARRTPGLVAECREAGVRFVQIFSAGFAETGEPEGIEAQRRLKAAMGADGPRIVGPNCMGVYCPGSGLSFCADYPREPGPIALICQSGGITGCTVRAVAERGLRFSKVASFGNAVDVDECDLLAYLAHDPQTKVIAAYIEGTKDGARFAEVLRAAAAAKPVVILKGGATDAGVRAAGSHTGALAGSDAVWDGLFRDAGVIRTNSVEETADMLVALLRMRPPRGTSTCLVGNGGGPTVLSTDECERAGFRIAPMPEEIRQRLLRFVPAAGTMVRNPLRCQWPQCHCGAGQGSGDGGCPGGPAVSLGDGDQERGPGVGRPHGRAGRLARPGPGHLPLPRGQQPHARNRGHDCGAGGPDDGRRAAVRSSVGDGHPLHH